MTEFKGFVFTDPNDDNKINELSFQFSQINATETKDRLSSFKAHKAPLTYQTVSETQEKRRLRALELQKQQRQFSTSKARQLALGDSNQVSSDEEEEEEEEEENKQQKRRRDSDNDVIMEDNFNKIKKYEEPKKKKKYRNIYSNQIMYAETLEMMPSDFIENWVMMICPKGKRCLVTSGGGHTFARARGGHLINKFQSVLPNGSRSNRNSDFCILDCVYDAVHWTFYVLDIMCWKGYPIYDCDTSFRHFWLQTRVQPHEFDKPNSENQFYKFKTIQPISLTENELQKVAENPVDYLKQEQQQEYPIDGLLFYHKETHYRGGSTPLVCWVPFENINTLLSS